MQKIKKFSARSTPEALKKVKLEMGDNALILGTTRVSSQSGKPSRIEVVAATTGDATPAARQIAKPASDRQPYGSRAKPAITDPEIGKMRDMNKDLVLELRQIEARLRDLLDKILLPADSPILQDPGKADQRLLSTGLDPFLVKKEDGGLPTPAESPIELLVEDLIDRVRFEPGLKRISVFLGASGSGKTTSVLKIAASVLLPGGFKPQVLYFGRDDERSTAWLRSQCKQLGVKFRKVSSIKKLDKILRKASKNPILIDTPGISDLTEEEVRYLGDAAKIHEGMRIKLVVDSGMDPQNLCAIASCVPEPSRMSLVLTKLDEASRIGGAVSMAINTRIPLAYVTGGRDISTGIYAANSALLSGKILESLSEAEIS
jgi:flagellar biosynthesis protein FlhF